MSLLQQQQYSKLIAGADFEFEIDLVDAEVESTSKLDTQAKYDVAVNNARPEINTQQEVFRPAFRGLVATPTKRSGVDFEI